MIRKFLLSQILFLGLCLLLLVFFLSQPISFGKSTSFDASVSASDLRAHVERLVNTPQPRNHINIESLNAAAEYISDQFSRLDCELEIQEFDVQEEVYKNISCIFRPTNSQINSKRIVVGAHYDVCEEQPGADDNASGVAGLLELAKLLHARKPTQEIELVAYTLEEPPYFRTNKMGSYIHAKSLQENNVQVAYMISLEMIGYFSDEENSQHFPIGFLGYIYPTKGNFIALIAPLKQTKLIRHIKSGFKANSNLPVYSMNAPAFIQGMDFSDHMNYTNLGFPALMVTDTSFLRNANYHEPTDTIDTLDFDKMKMVVEGVYGSLLNSNV